MQETLKQKLQDHWDRITVPGRMEAALPDQWSIQITRYYAGGELELKAQGKTVLEVRRDVEYGRIEISIPAMFSLRSERLYAFLDQICDACLRAAEIQAVVEAEASAAPILSLIDNLPEKLQPRPTVWAVAKLEFLAQGYVYGPCPNLDLAIIGMDEDCIAIEMDGSERIRGVMIDASGARTWFNADELKALTTEMDKTGMAFG